jgi:hypothetical protein
MKKYFLLPFTFSLLCILLYQFTAAQQPVRRRPLTQRDCYTNYKRQFDNFKNRGNYDLAIQKYHNAKSCTNLSYIQRRSLDSLIRDVNRKRMARRGVIRRF